MAKKEFIYRGKTLEELKAQTGALWLIDLLRRKGFVSEAMVRELMREVEQELDTLPV